MGDKILELPLYMALRGDGADSVFQQKLLGEPKLSTQQVVRVQYEIDCWMKTSKPCFSRSGEKKK